ncbi:MAG: radical SAM protein, partial [Clostridia bacterium]|nr:radical SAM protein [Clostridia bacterium]
VTEIIERHLKTIPLESSVEAAFFGGSFTGIPISEQSALMERVQPYIESGRIEGIRLSTRPDYINDEILENLKRYNVTTVELGVQSMSDEVLRAANRGHTRADAEEAARLIKKYGIGLGLQMMTGLPGDTHDTAIDTAKRIIALMPDCVRIYPTLVIKDTYLEKLYRDGRYTPQTVDEAAELAAELIVMFENEGITVIRVGLQPTEEINSGASVVAGPFHPAFGELAESAIYYNIAKSKLCGPVSDAIIYVNPREISKMTGNRRRNIARFKDELGINVQIKGDANLQIREITTGATQ